MILFCLKKFFLNHNKRYYDNNTVQNADIIFKVDIIFSAQRKYYYQWHSQDKTDGQKHQVHKISMYSEEAIESWEASFTKSLSTELSVISIGLGHCCLSWIKHFEGTI